MSAEFSVSGFKARARAIRSDQGKEHRYPERRKHPCLNSSMNVHDGNLSLNAEHGKVTVMKHKYKGTPAMREYWRELKQKERAKGKVPSNLNEP